jgi:hypothetical protein
MPPVAKDLIVYLKTGIGERCPIAGCNFLLGGEKFQQSCNHLLQEHGLNCLHVGQETNRDSNGELWQHTVAVFGK